MFAAYQFWKWLCDSTWRQSLISGFALGLAQLCKTTLLILFVIWPFVWLIQFLSKRQNGTPVRTSCLQLGAIMILSVYVINLGYGFSGSLIPIRQYEFCSNSLAGATRTERSSPHNIFANSSIGWLPVPLPRDYVQGIDRQRADFEEGWRSYLCGRWKRGGWWYYYVLGLAVKMPLGVLAIFLLSLSLVLSRRSAPGRYELFLLVHGVAILAFVSYQTGFNKHVRYAIPALPYFFVLSGNAAHALSRRVRWAAWTSVGLAAASSICVYPHEISYFNEAVGGPRNGHNYLLDSNIAWGQDLFYLKEWVGQNPHAKPLGLAAYGLIDPQIAGVEYYLPPVGPKTPIGERLKGDFSALGPKPGWYVIDVNFLHGVDNVAAAGNWTWRAIDPEGFNYEYFRYLKPCDRIAYSYLVYNVSRKDANDLRAYLRLPPLQSADGDGSQP